MRERDAQTNKAAGQPAALLVCAHPIEHTSSVRARNDKAFRVELRACFTCGFYACSDSRFRNGCSQSRYGALCAVSVRIGSRTCAALAVLSTSRLVR